jgi:hypothetical protein
MLSFHWQHQGTALNWVTFGEFENYDTSALYQTHRVCVTCFKLFKALDRLRRRELEMAWRLNIINDPNSLESIPEGTFPFQSQILS